MSSAATCRRTPRPGAGTAWTTVGGGRVEGIDGVDHLVFDLTLRPPTGTVTDLRLTYDPIMLLLPAPLIAWHRRWARGGDLRRHCVRIANARALHILTRETITAQSADIDTVSGATVTTDGYKESLQAALDAAHLS